MFVLLYKPFPKLLRKTKRLINYYPILYSEREKKTEKKFSMERIKSLLPSLREKKRYIKYDVVADSQINENDLRKEIDDTILRFLGEYGKAKAGVMVLKDNIIRVNTKYVNEVITALNLVKKCKSKEVMIKTKKVSGVLRKAKGG